MIVVMKRQCTDDDIAGVIQLIERAGSSHCVIDGAGGKVVEVLGNGVKLDRDAIARIPNVDKVMDRSAPLISAQSAKTPATREFAFGPSASVGGTRLAIIAGPCSVESEGDLLETAAAVKAAGATGLRGGVFKPRTSPYSFQGLGKPGLRILARAREETGLAIVTEVMDAEHVALVADHADMLQIGSRNMHNTSLLKAAGRQPRPVLLKRSWSATLEESLMAAEYILQAGNENVVFCERGIRTHEDYVRNTLALAIVPEIHAKSNLPVIVDPSHGTGRRHLVAPMSKAAIACGADGLLIEVHPAPDHAWTDGDQSIDALEFAALTGELRAIAKACGRTA